MVAHKERKCEQSFPIAGLQSKSLQSPGDTSEGQLCEQRIASEPGCRETRSTFGLLRTSRSSPARRGGAARQEGRGRQSEERRRGHRRGGGGGGEAFDGESSVEVASKEARGGETCKEDGHTCQAERQRGKAAVDQIIVSRALDTLDKFL